MVLKYKGSFKRDLELANRVVILDVYNAIINIKQASSAEQIHHLKKLRDYKTHYGIKIASDYRLGVIIRGNTVWFTCLGHCSAFYKEFP